MRVAVLGDASGWMKPVFCALSSLGVRVDLDRFSWPDDLVVVQVGDLIDKGPDGDHLVAWVDEVMRRCPGRWLQLFGNHEARFLGGPPFGGRGRYDVAPATTATLRRWANTGAARLAVALRTTKREWLVTHAGMTQVLWQHVGAPQDAATAAAALNHLLIYNPAVALQAGAQLLLDTESGVTWTTSEELYASWESAAMPFDQIVGHSSPYDFVANGWRADLPLHARVDAALATPDDEIAARRTWLPVGGRDVVFIDPGFGACRPRMPLVAFVLTNASVADR